MSKAKALIKYEQKSLLIQDNLDEMLRKIVDNMESIILKDVAMALKQKETPLTVVEKLYRAEFWKDSQERLYGKKSDLLDKFFRIYKKDIDSLKVLYPKSDFNISAIDFQLKEFDKFITSELDIIKLMGVSKSDAIGLTRMAQFGNITDSKELIDLIQGSLKNPLKNMKTRLFTTQSAVYRKNRANFYRTIKEGGKKYIYSGVQDGVTRKFCRHQGGKIRTKKEWEGIDNGQVGNAWDFGGGYNCRHSIYLVSNNWSSSEIEELQNDFTAQRMVKQ